MKAELVSCVTGEQSPNRTASRWQVAATDLGVCWDDGRGGVLLAFGDTFHPHDPKGGGAGGDWRNNVLARSTNRDLSQGVIIDWMAEDRPGHARQVIPRTHGYALHPVPPYWRKETTVIPTGGVSVGERNYMSWMSVRDWGAPGRWTTNFAGISYSDDGGNTWVHPSGSRWQNTPAGTQRYQMTALVRHDGHIYLFGTPHGRAGACYLARVPEDHVLDLERHEQWDGRRWRCGNPGSDQWRAAEVLPAPVSELSVMWHERSRRWLAAYYRESENAIVVHTATQLTGPWSKPQVVVTGREYPGLYGFFLHPWSMEDPEPVGLMSVWHSYQVMAMRLVGLT